MRWVFFFFFLQESKKAFLRNNGVVDCFLAIKLSNKKITLYNTKHCEALAKISSYFGISSTYCYNIASDIISSCNKVHKEECIKWISVSEKITKYSQTYQDFPSSRIIRCNSLKNIKTKIKPA